jgi:hypothetical protein
VVDRPVELDKGWQHWFQFVGARRPGAAFPAGSYTGTVTLEHAGNPPLTLRRRAELH